MATLITTCPHTFTYRMQRGMMHSVAATPAHAESRGFGDEKESSVHDKSCALSLKDPTTCKCKCGGRLHGSVWKTTAPGGPDVQAVPSRQSKVRRAVALAVAVTVAGTVGGIAVTGNFSASSNGSNNLSVQVSVDLSKAISALSLLGFGGRRTSNLVHRVPVTSQTAPRVQPAK